MCTVAERRTKTILVCWLAADVRREDVLLQKQKLLDLYMEELQNVCVGDAVLMEVSRRIVQPLVQSRQPGIQGTGEAGKVRRMLAEVQNVRLGLAGSKWSEEDVFIPWCLPWYRDVRDW